MVEEQYKNGLEAALAETIDRWYFSVKEKTKDNRIGFKKENLKVEIEKFMADKM
jgi:hypothetical protein